MGNETFYWDGLKLIYVKRVTSENSIRQISRFVLLMFLFMLTVGMFMSLLFSLLFMLMLSLCLCASENQPLDKSHKYRSLEITALGEEANCLAPLNWKQSLHRLISLFQLTNCERHLQKHTN